MVKKNVAVNRGDRRSWARCARALDRQADELSHHAAVAAMQHPDDHFLTDIAAFGEADGLGLDAGFEWDRVLVHVLAPLRHTGLDAKRL